MTRAGYRETEMNEAVLAPTTVEAAVWTTAYVNSLPDSAFLWIDQSEAKGKDDEGKTVPRTARHLPVRDASGKLDIAHLRNAAARAQQMKGVSAELKNRLMAKAQRLLAEVNKSSGRLARRRRLARVEVEVP